MAFKPQVQFFLKKTLGDEGYEQLSKFELVKEATQTVVDHQEVATALQIVPRAIISFLQKELSEMKDKEAKTLTLPVKEAAQMSVTKYTADVYSGEIFKDGKVLVRFKYRSIPGIGLVIMTTFELYDKEDVPKMAEASGPNLNEIQKIIDERLGLQSLVKQIVNQQISEREAIQQMINAKLSEMIVESSKEVKAEEPQKLKLKDFLEKRTQKLNKNEFAVNFKLLEKAECPDCGKNLLEGKNLSACVCLGEDMDKKILIKKTEDGVKLKFPSNFDPENIQVLLDIIKKRNRG